MSTTGTNRKPLRYTIRDAGDAIRRRETFIAGDGSLSGEYADDESVTDVGRLPYPLGARFVTACASAYRNHGRPLYVVRSYGTPIAWAGPGELLTVPDVRYSVTISRHQGIARRADDIGAGLPVTVDDWNAGYRGD